MSKGKRPGRAERLSILREVAGGEVDDAVLQKMAAMGPKQLDAYRERLRKSVETSNRVQALLAFGLSVYGPQQDQKPRWLQ